MNTKEAWDTGGWVPRLVAAGLQRCRAEQSRMAPRSRATLAELVVSAQRMAILCDREARWWTVLDRWTFLGQNDIPNVYGRAAMVASASSASRAGFYRDLLSDYRRRAAGQPVCSVLGCDCGGVCEVPA